MCEMKEEKNGHVDDDFMEERRRWEGVHNDEAAQSLLPFENASNKEFVTCCLLPILGMMGGLLAIAAAIVYGLYTVIENWS